MTLSYKMLLMMYLTDLDDSEGRVPICEVAEKFQTFFVNRAVHNKHEENPNVVNPGSLSSRTLSTWERTREQPVHYLTDRFVVDEGTSLRWAPRIRQIWNRNLKTAIYEAAFDRICG